MLVKIVRGLEDSAVEMSLTQQAAHARAVQKQTAPCEPLPDFSGFHPAFLSGAGNSTPEGDVRRAFFLAFMGSLDTPEIHGYDRQAGYRVYTGKALEIAQEEAS